MPNVTLSLKIAKDDPSKDAIAFESGETKRVFDKAKGQTIEIPKWNWVSRSYIQSMEPAGGDLVNVSVPEWIAKKRGMI